MREVWDRDFINTLERKKCERHNRKSEITPIPTMYQLIARIGISPRGTGSGMYLCREVFETVFETRTTDKEKQNTVNDLLALKRRLPLGENPTPVINNIKASKSRSP